MTGEGDLVLVHIENKPAFFARIESITPDVKPEWFHVKLLVLQVPLSVITWILRTPYINGEEFTMGGTPIRLAKVEAPEEPEETPEESREAEQREEGEGASQEEPSEDEETGSEKVVSLWDRKKRNE